MVHVPTLHSYNYLVKDGKLYKSQCSGLLVTCDEEFLLAILFFVYFVTVHCVCYYITESAFEGTILLNHTLG